MTPDPSPAASPGVDPWEQVYERENNLGDAPFYRCPVCHKGWSICGPQHHRPCVMEKVDAALAAERQQHTAEIARLQEWTDIVTRGKSPCGHWSAYSFTANAGKLIECYACRAEHEQVARLTAEAEVASLTQQLQTIGAACGFPVVNNHQQLAETICKAIRRRDTELAAAQTQIATLREALRQADEWIQRGQACRSEAEFTRWMHDVQAERPAASLTRDQP